MRRAMILVAALAAALLSADRLLGFSAAYDLAYGAVTVLAAAIAASFGWLWRARATPLALGMAVSWAGAGGLTAWWWVAEMLGRPVEMVEGPALFGLLALYIGGALLHLDVIAGVTHRPRAVFGGVVTAALLLPALLHALA